MGGMTDVQRTQEDAQGQGMLLHAATALVGASRPESVLPDLYARAAGSLGFRAFAHVDHESRREAIASGLVMEARVVANCPPTETLATVSDAPTPLAAALRGAGLTHYLCESLIVEGRRRATLLFATCEPGEVHARAAELVHELGALVAVALTRSRGERDANSAADDVRQLFEALDQGMCIIEMFFDDAGEPVDYQFLAVNSAFESQTGLHRPVGRTARELVPDLDESWYRIYGEVALTGRPHRFENHAPAMNRWFDVYAMRVGAAEDRRVALVFRDVSERKRHERNTTFLAELNAELSACSRPREILKVAGRMLGEHMGVSRIVFSEVDEQLESLCVFHEWTSLDVSILGDHRRADFANDELVDTIRAGRIVAVSDVETDRRTSEYAERYALLRIQAVLHAPHRSGGRIKFMLSATRVEPYEWNPEEVELMSELSTQLWLRLERAWAEDTVRTIADKVPVALWMTDASNSCVFLNRYWQELTGQTEREGLGTGWTDATHPDDRERTFRVFAEAAEKRVPFALDYRLRTPDGSYRWAIDAGVPRFDPDGQWQGYVGSVTDVHDRKLAEEKLRQADRRKDQFMALLSHELRNPLAPIRNGLYVLEEAEPDSESAARARQIIRRQVEQLARLVDDLLDITRITRGKVELRRELVDLRELVRHTVEDHRPLFESKGVRASVELSLDSIHVHGDPNRLKQAVGNLLQNAAKFTKREQAAAVTVERDEEHAIVRVVDTGAGMEPSTIAGLFEPFMQADDSLARSAGGLGLGLALVRSIAELHGGEVRARSDGLGRGSCFELRLPVSAEAVRESDPDDARDEVRPLFILLIEDSVDVAESMQMLLEMEGHAVIVAGDGIAGLEKARSETPDVVLCDLGLPGLDGYGVARALSSDPNLAEVHRVALSGYALPEDVARAKAAGFHHHLAKPASLDKLREVLAAGP